MLLSDVTIHDSFLGVFDRERKDRDYLTTMLTRDR